MKSKVKSKMSFLLVGFFLFTMSTNIMCQSGNLSTPEDAIASLFKAMYDGDSTLAGQVFAEGASLNSVYTSKNGVQKVKAGEIDGFITAIGTPHEEIWDERISNLEVKIDGDLANAWMDYSFYVDDKFSHCGVNSMHLVRKDGLWKILQIVDTRRKKDCN